MSKKESDKLIKLIKSLKLTPKSLHEPTFKGNEVKYLKDCIKTGYVSSIGQYVKKFEEKIINLTKSKYAVAVINGTYGLEISLRSLEIKNKEVLLPSLTFVATANAIYHSGGIPNFVDVDESNLGICPKKLEKYIKKIAIKKNGKLFNKKTKNQIKALVAVHVFGFASKIDELKKICKKYNLILLEDAAEAIGSYYQKKHLGTFGKIGVISFNGNKTITCGNGGVVLTSDKSTANYVRHLTTTAKEKHKYEYLHDEIGFNLRLSNINAAIGCAQLEKLNKLIVNKRKNFVKYSKYFREFNDFKILREPKNSKSNYWLISLKLLKNLKEKNYILNKLNKYKIYCRPVWKPLHTLKMYKNFPRDNLNITTKLYNSIINLPSSPSLKI